jgi:catechol 2,3-dioxygenase-like lactoylglutathione lyase family enzyme
MNAIRHIATCTKNNRRIARFYRFIFDMEELWNDQQNSPFSYYLTDGYINMNCLLIHPGLKRSPKVGIEHFGVYVDNLDETMKKILAFDHSIRLEDSPRDGRYEDKRFNDPEGNRLEIATNPWGTEGNKKISGIRHLAIHAKDLERLADFYKTVFNMREVGKRVIRETDSTVLNLSDGAFSLALIKNAPIGELGIQLFGIQVHSIADLDEKLKQSVDFLYPGEAPIELIKRLQPGPYGSHYLYDPDGNCVEVSQEGWEA